MIVAGRSAIIVGVRPQRRFEKASKAVGAVEGDVLVNRKHPIVASARRVTIATIAIGNTIAMLAQQRNGRGQLAPHGQPVSTAFRKARVHIIVAVRRGVSAIDRRDERTEEVAVYSRRARRDNAMQ